MIKLELKVYKDPQNPNTPNNLPPDPEPKEIQADDLGTLQSQVGQVLRLRSGDYRVNEISYEQIVSSDQAVVRAKQLWLDYIWPT